MNKFFSAALVFVLFPAVGCENNAKTVTTSVADTMTPSLSKPATETARKNILAKAQPSGNIEMVVSKNYLPPIVNFSAAGVDAAMAIVAEFNKWAAISCSKKIDASLGKKWDEDKTKYVGKFPAGSKVLFLVLVDKFNCEVIGMLPESQIVRVKENVCSVSDIKVDRPDMIYNPDNTGFFTVKVRFD
jgi:hypothetical protein